MGYPRDVEEVILGERGTLAGLASGGIAVDMTTSSPSLAEAIAREAAAKGVGSVDAPVTGGDIGAANGTLSVMMGGDEAVCAELDRLMVGSVATSTTHFGG